MADKDKGDVKTGNDPENTDPLKEGEVTPLDGGENKPAADVNPNEAVGEGRSWPNLMDTAPDAETGEPLSFAQKARIEGTPLDGSLGFTATHEPTKRSDAHDDRGAFAGRARGKAADKKKDDKK